MSNHVEVKNIEPTTFEDRYFDEYEYYNLTDRYTECTSRKGRTKKEASCNTNRQNPAGHERKIVEKLQNAEKKSKEFNRTAITGNRPQVPLRETGAGLQEE
ncbi:Nuclear protein 1 [Anabarilius grahami]|uniref:Nuclear protein 1 n=1 Tax=Anabarilius grahami TaxID=495550 RepID=A0A3N0Y3H0_ANAGA|nr:Nuclear protein 1 [Anabarilius grahami]